MIGRRIVFVLIGLLAGSAGAGPLAGRKTPLAGMTGQLPSPGDAPTESKGEEVAAALDGGLPATDQARVNSVLSQGAAVGRFNPKTKCIGDEKGDIVIGEGKGRAGRANTTVVNNVTLIDSAGCLDRGAQKNAGQRGTR